MRIVMVEDNDSLARGVSQVLGDHGHAVDWLADAATADAFLAGEGADLAIIDVNLPDGSGLDILRAMRARRDATPVLLLTARGTVKDRVEGLDAGADDYLVKPFEMAELLARLRALARRRAGAAASVESFGKLSVDRAGGLLTGPQGALALSRRELALFEALFEQHGRVVSKDTLCARVYGTGADVEINAVELLISRLRRKLAGTGVGIRTIRGLGYVLKEEDESARAAP